MSKNNIILTLALVAVIIISLLNIINSSLSSPFSNSWEQALPLQKTPAGLTSLSSKECGACHTDYYDEWQSSTHAMAWKDVQFQAEIAKESSPYLCINCHIPLQNQQEYIITGLENDDIYKPIREINPEFNAELQQEGINCAACHVRDGAVVAKSVSNRAPHKSIEDKSHLTEQLCISCHNAVAVVTPELVCTFETGDEWKESPYFDKKNCINCHMPPIMRPISEGGKSIKNARMHYFMGSGIAKHDTLHVERLDGLNFGFENVRPQYNTKDSARLSITATNMFAGHRVPTGDPERFITIVLSILEAKSDSVIADRHFRIGEHWEWYPVAKKISDNNMDPGEKRRFQVAAKLPKGNYKLLITANKHRTTNEMVVYNKLGDSYPIKMKFFEKTMIFTVVD